MFADYRVPQILNFYGILKYDDYLMKKLKSNPHLNKFSEEEIEIRGCSIWSVEVRFFFKKSLIYKYSFVKIKKSLLDVEWKKL